MHGADAEEVEAWVMGSKEDSECILLIQSIASTRHYLDIL